MKDTPLSSEDAITGLEVVILFTVLLIIGIHIAFNVLGNPLPPPRHAGLLPGALRQTGTQLNVYGGIIGYSAVNGPVGTAMVQRDNVSPDRLGGVGMTMSIFTGGDGGIDMARTAVHWTDRAGTEVISLTRLPTVICPNWTIVGKHTTDPSKSADDDDILEPGEAFDLFICPSKTYAPYDQFTIEYDPPGSGPLFPVKCSVPSPVLRTMVL